MRLLLSVLTFLSVVSCSAESGDVVGEVGVVDKDSVTGSVLDSVADSSKLLDSITGDTSVVIDSLSGDTSQVGDGAISGDVEKIEGFSGDSILFWDKISESIVLENGEVFNLTWVDQFDSTAINKQRWSMGSWTFPENESFFHKSQVQQGDTTLSLVLSYDSLDLSSEKDYLGAEVYSRDAYKFGRYVCRMKPNNPSGVISSFFLIDIVDDHDWYELDIEFVGENTNKVQFNLRTRLPGESRIKDKPVTVDLPFDAADDFHVYTIDWTEKYVSFYVDGVLMYKYDDEEFVARQAHEQTVRFNYWPTNLPKWSGEFDTTSLPSKTEYDYIAVYAN